MPFTRPLQARKTTTYDAMSRVIKKLIAKRMLPLSPADGEVLLRGLHNATKSRGWATSTGLARSLSTARRAAHAHLVDAERLLEILEAFPKRSRYSSTNTLPRGVASGLDDMGSPRPRSPFRDNRLSRRRPSLEDDFMSDDDDVALKPRRSWTTTHRSPRSRSNKSRRSSPRRRVRRDSKLSPTHSAPGSPGNRKPWGAPPRRYKVGDEIEAQCVDRVCVCWCHHCVAMFLC